MSSELHLPLKSLAVAICALSLASVASAQPVPATGADTAAAESTAVTTTSAPAEAAAPEPEPELTPIEAARAELERDQFKVGILADAPPFSFETKNGFRRGFDYEIARQLCRTLKIKCEYVPLPEPDVISSLRDRRIDFAVASTSINPDTREMVDFTEPYYRTISRFIAPGDKSFGFGRGNVVIGVLSGSVHDRFLTNEHGEVTVQRYTRPGELWIDLVLGRLDGALTDASAAQQGLLSRPIGEDFVFSGPAVSDPDYFGEGQGIAVRKGDAALEDALDLALAELRSDGTYAELRQRYLDDNLFAFGDF